MEQRCTSWDNLGHERRPFSAPASKPGLSKDGVYEILLAQTGEGIAECEVLSWNVKEGQEVGTTISLKRQLLFLTAHWRRTFVVMASNRLFDCLVWRCSLSIIQLFPKPTAARQEEQDYRTKLQVGVHSGHLCLPLHTRSSLSCQRKSTGLPLL